MQKTEQYFGKEMHRKWAGLNLQEILKKWSVGLKNKQKLEPKIRQLCSHKKQGLVTLSPGSSAGQPPMEEPKPYVLLHSQNSFRPHPSLRYLPSLILFLLDNRYLFTLM